MAGCVGGPSITLLVTPLRNALTYAARDPSSTTLQIYRQVFNHGPMAGGRNAMLPAVPGFFMLGPGYHVFEGALGSRTGAVACTALAESLIFYGAETRNAVIAHNTRAAAAPLRVPELLNPVGYRSPSQPIHPGFVINVARNMLAMSGLRVFSYPAQNVIAQIGPSMPVEARHVAGDLLANVVVSALSTPLHQLYGFVVTQPAHRRLTCDQALEFFRSQYIRNGRFSKAVGRDVILRVGYNATVFTLFGLVDRTAKRLFADK